MPAPARLLVYVRHLYLIQIIIHTMENKSDQLSFGWLLPQNGWPSSQMVGCHLKTVSHHWYSGNGHTLYNFIFYFFVFVI